VLQAHPDAKAILVDAPWSFLDAALERALFGDAEPAWPEDHAGRLETAVMRHIAPDLVGEAPAPEPYSPRAGYDVLPTPPDSVPSSGVVNDARDVTADVGRRCLDAMVDGIAAAVAAEF
jgi:creatinine amidohydrolase